MVKVESNTAPVNVAIARFSDMVDKMEVDAHAQTTVENGPARRNNKHKYRLRVFRFDNFCQSLPAVQHPASLSPLLGITKLRKQTCLLSRYFAFPLPHGFAFSYYSQIFRSLS